MTVDPAEAVGSGAAWREFCGRLADLGDALLDDAYPSGERDRTEGYRHLATQTVAWLSWAVGYPDPEFPAFFRQNDLVVRWGGPNVDQTTRRARVAPDGIYRISGNMGACEDFILTLKNGDMHLDRYGIASETMASDLGFDPGDDVDVVVSATEQPGTWIRLPPEATLLNLREYYWDWQPKQPATFVIERLDTQGRAPAALTPQRFSAMLGEAGELIGASLPYWNDFVRRERAKLPANTMGPPSGAAGGSARIRYSFGFFELGPDEAMLIDADISTARFWDLQLYSLGWFESLDFANRTTSLNHTQGLLNADGRFRAVIAATDPGVPNWLDSEGRAAGMVTQRWIDVSGSPTITSNVVPLAEVRALLPSDTPQVTPEERREQIRRRQAHVAWRYRT